MTAQDYEIQKLRREVEELKRIRQLDMAEIVRLRRIIESMADDEFQ